MKINPIFFFKYPEYISNETYYYLINYYYIKILYNYFNILFILSFNKSIQDCYSREIEKN